MIDILRQRGLDGDLLLDALDTAKDIIGVSGHITEDGKVFLYHATSRANAEIIVREQAMFGKEE